jgi:hypothetical protein
MPQQAEDFPPQPMQANAKIIISDQMALIPNSSW